MKNEKPRTKKDNDRGRRRKTAAGRALNEDSEVAALHEQREQFPRCDDLGDGQLGEHAGAARHLPRLLSVAVKVTPEKRKTPGGKSDKEERRRARTLAALAQKYPRAGGADAACMAARRARAVSCPCRLPQDYAVTRKSTMARRGGSNGRNGKNPKEEKHRTERGNSAERKRTKPRGGGRRGDDRGNRERSGENPQKRERDREGRGEGKSGERKRGKPRGADTKEERRR